MTDQRPAFMLMIEALPLGGVRRGDRRGGVSVCQFRARRNARERRFTTAPATRVRSVVTARRTATGPHPVPSSETEAARPLAGRVRRAVVDDACHLRQYGPRNECRQPILPRPRGRHRAAWGGAIPSSAASRHGRHPPRWANGETDPSWSPGAHAQEGGSYAAQSNGKCSSPGGPPCSPCSPRTCQLQAAEPMPPASRRRRINVASLSPGVAANTTAATDLAAIGCATDIPRMSAH